MIELAELTVRFGGTCVLDGLNATLSDPVCGLIGPNGAGKTTLLNVLSGFVRPSTGRVLLDDFSLLELSPAQRVRLGIRRSFQTEQIVEDLSAFQNVLALAEHVLTNQMVHEAAAQALEYVGMTAYAGRRGSELNLFQRRMIELAKAIVGRPRLLLLDEPGAGLTEFEANRLREALLGIPALTGAQVLLIDHDVDLIAACCTQTLVLDYGKRLALGQTRAVLDDPLVRSAYLGKEMTTDDA